MDTIIIISLIVGCSVFLAYFLLTRSTKSRPSDRPCINIDFDNAKEHEDKNRYFS